MRKIVILFLMLLGFSFNVFAISSSEILDNPGRFLKIASSAFSDIYIDSSSLKVIRYNPPGYILEGSVYEMDYGDEIIRIHENTKFYYKLSEPYRVQILPGRQYVTEFSGKLFTKGGPPPEKFFAYSHSKKMFYIAAQAFFMKAYNMKFPK